LRILSFTVFLMINIYRYIQSTILFPNTCLCLWRDIKIFDGFKKLGSLI